MDEESQTSYVGAYIIPMGVACTWMAFFYFLKKAQRCSKEDMLKGARFYSEENLLSDEFIYNVIIQTGYEPESGTCSTVALRIVGDEACTLTYLLRQGLEKYLLTTGSRIGVCITSSFDVGRVRAIVFEADTRFPRSDWKVDRVDLWDEVHARHYVFVINRVLLFSQRQSERVSPLGAGDGQNLIEVPVSVRFSRTLRLFHLPLSVVDFPYGSRYSRVQRLASVMAIGMDAMLVDCALHGWCPENGGSGVNLIAVLLSSVYLIGIVFACTLLITFAFEFCYQGTDRDQWARPPDIDLICKTAKSARGCTSRADSSRDPSFYYRNQDITAHSDAPSMCSRSTNLSPQPTIDASAFLAHADGLRLRRCYPPSWPACLLPWTVVATSMVVSTPLVCVCAACYDMGTCLSWLLTLTAAGALTCFVVEPAKALLIAFVFRDF